ncbi:MAG: c-type cytochrome [Alcaligenaceae bacterium]|nr:c-type cytochrome [Alcaligenaceae bacterium]
MNNTKEHVEETTEEHEGLIKTPKQLIVTVILAFIVPIVVILLLVNLVATSSKLGAGSDAQTDEAIASRIKPVAGFSLVDANAPKVVKTGQQVYESTCTACHAAGVAGAPKMGDKDAWAPYIAKGYEDMLQKAIHGVGAMPPKGGNPALSDFEVARAVVYIANQSGASFEEPKEAAGEGEQAADGKAAAAPAAPQAAAPAAPAQAAAPAAPADTAAAAAPAAPAPAAESASIDPAGEQLYKTICFACHAAGIAGAPKTGDKNAWAPLIAQGMDTMVSIAINGKGAMPPRGGSQASDAEIKAAVQYMVQAAK